MKIGQSSTKYYKFIVYVVVVVLLNVTGLTLFTRTDLTAGKLYSISDVSKRVVATLTEPLTINVFFTKNLPAPYNNIERYLRDLLAEYTASANQYFNYRFFDVSADQGDLSEEAMENQRLANSFGIQSVQIQAIEKDEVKFQKAFMGLVILHGDQIERLPRIMATDGLEYRLTTAIRNLNNKVSALLALEDKVRVKLYLSSSLNEVASLMKVEQLRDLPGKIEDIVKRINDKNYGKLAFDRLDPTKDADLSDEIKRHRILKLNWPDIVKSGIKAGEGAIGLVMSYKDKSVTTPLMQVMKVPMVGTRYNLIDLGQLEEVISGNVASLIDINQNLGVLTDFSTFPILSPPTENLFGPQEVGATSFKNQLSQNYSFKGIKLKEGAIPDSFDCLMIVGPTETFSDYDLFHIDQFLMKGKSLAIFLDGLEEIKSDRPEFQTRGMHFGYLPLETGLEKLLAHYGIEIIPSAVMDEECFYQVIPRERGGGEQPIYFAPLIKNENINNRLDYMQNIKGLIALKTSPITVNFEKIKENNLNAQSLFRSSARSWEVKKNINFQPVFIKPPGQDVERKSFDLAYMVEGEFPSYFAGKSVPEKPQEEEPDKTGEGNKEANEKAEEGEEAEKAAKSSENEDTAASTIEGEGNIIEKGKSGKIFILTSTEMIKDNIMRDDGRGANDIFLMNVVDYLNDQVGVAQMRSKQQQLTPLDETSVFTKTAVKTINIAALPVLVVAFGLLAWVRRLGRRKEIQRMFKPETSEK